MPIFFKNHTGCTKNPIPSDPKSARVCTTFVCDEAFFPLCRTIQPVFFFASSISHHTPPFHILHAVCALFRRHDGTVTWDGLECPQGMQIEGTGVHRINGNLAVARAIGDVDCRPWVSGEVPPS